VVISDVRHEFIDRPERHTAVNGKPCPIFPIKNRDPGSFGTIVRTQDIVLISDMGAYQLAVRPFGTRFAKSFLIGWRCRQKVPSTSRIEGSLADTVCLGMGERFGVVHGCAFPQWFLKQNLWNHGFPAGQAVPSKPIRA
jgi:hypothetical protein